MIHNIDIIWTKDVPASKQVISKHISNCINCFCWYYESYVCKHNTELTLELLCKDKTWPLPRSHKSQACSLLKYLISFVCLYSVRLVMLWLVRWLNSWFSLVLILLKLVLDQVWFRKKMKYDQLLHVLTVVSLTMVIS